MGAHPESLSAVTLVVTDMARSMAFYESLGFRHLYGEPTGEFTSYGVGDAYVNLQLGDAVATGWGRFIVWVDDVDAMYARALDGGRVPSTTPTDAPWGERYFHLDDPDGHEISFARPLDR